VFPEFKTTNIRGKLEVARDRLRVYEDVLTRDPTSRMIESAHTDIADAINYTVDGFLMVMGKDRGQYRNNLEALGAAYPYVDAAVQQSLPALESLQAILEHFPTETKLGSIIIARASSVHEYGKVIYTPQETAQEAYDQVFAFWAGAVIATQRVPGLNLGLELE